MTRQTVRVFLLIEAALFLAAVLTHFGVLMSGLEHRKAGTAESVIGCVLLAGLILTLIRPESTRAVGLVVQAFALLGTAVGIFTIAIGVGPRTVPDIVFHGVLVIGLVSGLIATARMQRIPATAAGRS